MRFPVALHAMAWRIHQAVVRGEIDNRVRGVITGTIWVVDGGSPIELALTGNCWRDMAGCLLTFTNPSPQKADEHADLNRRQCGEAGDMTASRKVRVLDIPIEAALDMIHRGEKPPEHLGNSLYLEWYSESNGRVVIESSSYHISISEPCWQMNEADEARQRTRNGDAFSEWMARLDDTFHANEAHESIKPAIDPKGSRETRSPMNEFEWEKFMKESDKRTDRLTQLYEQYEGLQPEERERRIAHEMGWDKLDEAPDSNPEERQRERPDRNDSPDPSLNPLTEHVDWVLDRGGHPVHPLYLHCFNLISEFRNDCNQAGALAKKPAAPLEDLIFFAHRLNATLAGALNNIWTGHVERAFIVAYLKRSLNWFNEAMGQFPLVCNKHLVRPERLERFQTDLCAIREEILRLMDQARNSPPGHF